MPEAVKKFKKKVASFPYMSNNYFIIKQKHKSQILWNEAKETWHEYNLDKLEKNTVLGEIIPFYSCLAIQLSGVVQQLTQ